jgi:hypothetical protein
MHMIDACILGPRLNDDTSFWVILFSVCMADESYLTNGYLDTPIDWIAGMPTVRLGDISGFVRTLDPQCFRLRVEEEEANSCARAQGLILNTFEELESDVLDALREEIPRVYTIGPLAAAVRRRVVDDNSAPGLSLWEEDAACVAWLDAQAAGSVLYVSFGSLAVLSLDQLAEFAWGLAASGVPFLWVVRPGLVAGDRGADALPEEFLAETKGRCFVAEWCAQERVLRHRAVGCFLTHNGWNSTCEGLAAGVPMVCWPVYADQFTNCKYACKVWGVGRRLDAEVRRDQVAAHVNEAMESEEVRRSAARWKEEAETAARAGGSSHENLLSMVKALGVISSVNTEA